MESLESIVLVEIHKSTDIKRYKNMFLHGDVYPSTNNLAASRADRTQPQFLAPETSPSAAPVQGVWGGPKAEMAVH